MKLLIVLSVAFIGSNLHSSEYLPTPIEGTEMSCESLVTNDIPWSYCITKVTQSRNQDVVYHFHGRNGNATWWNDTTYHTGEIHRSWIERELDPPTVISISFGKLWLLTDSNSEKQSLHFDLFFNNILPFVEEKLEYPFRKRIAFGISMGGANATLASLNYPRLFDKTVILCSTLPNLSHHSSFSDLWDYFRNTSISLKRAAMKYYFSKKFFPTKEDWEINNPVSKINLESLGSLPEMYISCGAKDDWDCMSGSQAIVDKAQLVGAKVIWEPRSGGHCDINHEAVASFIVE